MRWVVAGAVGLLVAACAAEPRANDRRAGSGDAAEVRVFADGVITLDGSEVSLAQLSLAFADVKAAGGAVWYYREGGASEPHPNAIAVIQAIVDAQLPVSMSSQEDFSDVVLPDGTTRPRER